MATELFEIQLEKVYQGEIVGEVAFDGLLATLDDSQQRYKIATVLQLETETKARLRPAMIELGMSVAEKEESRVQGLELVDLVKGLDWKDAMQVLMNIIEPYLTEYQSIAENAPLEYRTIAESMLIHEKLLYDFLSMEAAGEGDNSLDGIIELLAYPLPSP